MFKFFYRWKHRRAHRIAAFRLPGDRDREIGQARINFSSYLAQSSVRGKPRSQHLPTLIFLWLRRIAFLAVLVLLGWMVYQSTLALIFFAD
ncbi:MAG: hypothetical protein GWO81_06670 [Verrucomicrobia bacterium]|nr:hypothetical protein [Verrucomicrobiota bacterium]